MLSVAPPPPPPAALVAAAPAAARTAPADRAVPTARVAPAVRAAPAARTAPVARTAPAARTAPHARTAAESDRDRSVLVGLRSSPGPGYRSQLVRLRPRTLAAAKPPITLPASDPSGLAVAPDGRRVAVATTTSVTDTPRTRITIASVRSWRRSRTIRVPARLGDPRAIAWLRADRVLVFGAYAGGGPLSVVAIDPLAGRVLTRPRELGAFEDPRPTGDRVVLTAGAKAAQVLVLDADGRETARIDAGDLSGPDLPYGPAVPSWTTDPATGHLLGISESAPVLVDVDPGAGTATRHALATSGMSQHWIEGARDATRLAFGVREEDGRTTLVPVDRATLATLPPTTMKGFNDPDGAGDLVLAPSGALSDEHLKGLRAYALDGTRRWTAEPGHRTTSGYRHGDVIYAAVQGVGDTILDAKTGKTLRRGPRRQVQVFDPQPGARDQPWVGVGGGA